MSDRIKTILCVLLVFALAAIVGYALPLRDIDGAQAEAERYCQMVHQGHWPDFHHDYKLYCTSEGHWNGQ